MEPTEPSVEHLTMQELIERSSLGSRAARAIRRRTPRWVVAEIIKNLADVADD